MQTMAGLRAALVGTATGLAVTLVGVHAYAFLGGLNVQHAPDIPWAPAVAAPLLWLFWRYVGGWGWPRQTAEWRRRMRRANPIPRQARGPVLAAGIAGFIFAGSAMTFGFRLSDLPPDAVRPPPVPVWTLVPAIIMLSAVAGVCEEVGIRGYVQKPLVEAGFPLAGVLWSATVFVLLHGNHEWFVAQSGPMFVAAVWYGWYTARTDSIYPMIMIHALLDVTAFGYLWLLGGPLPASIHQDGLTPAFWLNVAVSVVSLIVAVALTARIPPIAGLVTRQG